MFDQVELVLCWINRFLVGYHFRNLDLSSDKMGGQAYLSIHQDYHFDETSTQDMWGCGDLAYVKNFQATKCYRKKDPHQVEERANGTRVRGLSWMYRNNTILGYHGWWACYDAKSGKAFTYNDDLEERMPSTIKPTRTEMRLARMEVKSEEAHGWQVRLVPDTRWITI